MRVPLHSQEDANSGALRRARGFTIVELMITVAVAAILLIIAVPSFNNIINTNRLNTAVNAMVGALNSARMEAIKRNGSVQFCSNSASSNNGTVSDTLSTACGTSSGAVLALTGSTATPVLASPSQLVISSLQIRGTIAAIRFDGQGLGYAPGSTTPYDTTTAGAPVVDICSTALTTDNDIQIDMATGTIITTTDPSTVTCP
ncbi:GspH/FimT family pseudopilin [Rhodanobacter sp. DHB23]|uniref:GspH/FimT family pseudopilin n=1 Tax=Rhodanobacter sp. DHB23 TaxID=2775923 RepID=UPI001784156E|nr:GspH/FimT family pseudopilin [Rhodanobacter sp. DHB23]MBD8871997.1 GspH/FimT family pseudopilin [Rhodanobacter sp. DHB23]